MMQTATEFGARVERRLREEAIAWLVTVRDDGTPQASPVWFLWDGETFLIYSQPNTPKLRNIARNPKVGLHLNSDAYGNDVVTFTGEAQVDAAAPPAPEVPAMVRKYRDDLRAVDSTEAFTRTMDGYSVAIRVKPTKVRGF